MSENMNNEVGSEEEVAQPVFSIEKIYVKDISLEAPHTPNIFLEQGQSEIDMQLDSVSRHIDKDFYECVITVTATATLPDKRVLFLVEVKQAGVFRISEVPEEDLEPILGIACPNILFPYARESVSNIVTRAGFMPVLLSPVNFEALFMQRKQQQLEEQGSTLA